MRVPHTELKPDMLCHVIEAFVTREGTDYGLTERTLDSKIAEVLRQLELGHAFVTYDEASDSCSIVAKNAPPQPAPSKPQDNYTDRSEPRWTDEPSQAPWSSDDDTQIEPDYG